MKSCILMLLWLVLTTSSAVAQNLGQRDFLAGMKAISVVVEKLDADLEGEGLSREQLQTDIELRLRKARVSILTPKRPNEVMISELYIRVSALKLKGVLAGAYAVSINLEVIQAVYLGANNLKLTTATTWSTNTIASVGASNIGQLRDGLGDTVDKFLNDYLAANPK